MCSMVMAERGNPAGSGGQGWVLHYSITGDRHLSQCQGEGAVALHGVPACSLQPHSPSFSFPQ